MNNLKTIIENKIYEYNVKSSSFLTYCYYVTSNNEALDFIKSIQNEHKKAKHICYAYKLIDNNQIKIYEDNEPSNSSGRKIYDVIENNDLTNILIIVVRYMDKSKLGLGLLTRSYFNAANLIISDNNICTLKKMNIYKIKTTFSEYNNTINLLLKNKEKIFSKEVLENTCVIVSTLENSSLLLNKSKLIKVDYVKIKNIR